MWRGDGNGTGMVLEWYYNGITIVLLSNGVGAKKVGSEKSGKFVMRWLRRGGGFVRLEFAICGFLRKYLHN